MKQPIKTNESILRGILLPLLLAFSLLALFIGWNFYKGLPPDQEKAGTDQPVIREHLPDTMKPITRLALHDFEWGDPSDSNSHLALSGHTGKQSFRLTAGVPFSPGLWIRFSELKPGRGAWLCATGYVWFTGRVVDAKCSLVATCNRNGINYKYMAIPVERENVKPGMWNRISINYCIPEPVREEDALQVYFWYRGAGEMLVDDISIEVYE